MKIQQKEQLRYNNIVKSLERNEKAGYSIIKAGIEKDAKQQEVLKDKIKNEKRELIIFNCLCAGGGIVTLIYNFII